MMLLQSCAPAEPWSPAWVGLGQPRMMSAPPPRPMEMPPAVPGPRTLTSRPRRESGAR